MNEIFDLNGQTKDDHFREFALGLQKLLAEHGQYLNITLIIGALETAKLDVYQNVLQQQALQQQALIARAKAEAQRLKPN